MEIKYFTFSMPADMHRQLTDLSQKTDLSMKGICKLALKEFFDKKNVRVITDPKEVSHGNNR
jgi:hypothetical protein